MERRTIEVEIDYTLDWRYGVTIAKMKEDIAELEKLGATHVFIDITYDQDIRVVCERVETKEEAIVRVYKEEKNAEKEKRKAIAHIKQLKKKYGI